MGKKRFRGNPRELPEDKLLILRILATMYPKQPATMEFVRAVQKEWPVLRDCDSNAMTPGRTHSTIRWRIGWLEKKGFLVSRWQGSRRLWAFGPASDELKDLGLLT